MKKHVSFTLIMLIGMLMGFAQTDGISYQAVIIDNNPQEIPGVDVTSNSLPNTPLKVRFSIIDNTSQIEYQETQDTETDAFGMINLMIGQGELTSETLTTFNQVYWDNEKFLRVEIDLFDGNGFVEFSYQNLTYIPYIRHREIIATSTLDVDGATNLNNSLSVNNGSPTHLTGSLTTDGATDLNANLTVNNQSPTYLTGDLTVDGLVSFDGELAVGGDTQLYSDLTVEGNSMLNGSLDVVGQATFNSSIFEDIIVNQSSILNTITASGATQINNTLTVSQNSNLNSATINQVGADPNLNSLIVNGRSLLSGRVLINPQLTTNSQNNANSYPLEIRGRHGIWISTNNGTPSSNNNFLTFSNSSNSPVGAIEGQTLNELNNSFRFIWDASAALLEEAFIVAEGVACGAQLDLGEAGVMAVQGFAAYAHLLELTINATNNVGVSFKTGGADYAEFLEKENHTMQFESGEIVGVFGGKISKTTKGAQHIMVISTNPIVLGNMPESLSTENFEKVAFLGQVPVRVVGRVGIGDYILPSGNNDGLAIAKTPEKMTLSDYSEIIGVAWQASLGDVFGYINVAIGLNTNDLAFQLQQQQKEIEAVKKELKAIHTLLKGDNDNIQNEATINNVETSNQLNSRISLFRSDRNDIKMSEAEFEEWLNKYGYIFENRMTLLGNYLKENNVNISEYPEIEKLITNTKQALRDMNNGKYMKTLWESFQKRYPKAFTTK